MTSDLARILRRNSTEAEKALWRLLRNRFLGSAKFRRQCPIGRYVADFVCTEHCLIIEAARRRMPPKRKTGRGWHRRVFEFLGADAPRGQHTASETDAARTVWLESQGFRVLRFWNRDILENPEGVAAAILRELEDARSPPPHPAADAATLSRKGRGLT